jgi:hypothetical protein
MRVSVMPSKSKVSVGLLCLPLRFAGIFKIWLASFAEFRRWLECLVSRKCCDKLHAIKIVYNYKCAAYHLIIDAELWIETPPKHTLKSRTWLVYSLKWWQGAEEHNRERKNNFIEKELSARLSSQKELWNGHVLFNFYQTLPQRRTISEEQKCFRVFF